MSLAVVGAVVAEFVAADRGLGYYLLYANGQLDTPGVFGALLVLTVIGVLLYYMVEAVERLFVPSALSKDGTRRTPRCELPKSSRPSARRPRAAPCR